MGPVIVIKVVRKKNPRISRRKMYLKPTPLKTQVGGNFLEYIHA